MSLLRRMPRTGPFASRFRRGTRGTRGGYRALYVTLLVKILLFVFFWMLFASTIRAGRTGLRGLPMSWRIALPTAVALSALVTGYFIFNNIMEIRRYKKGLREGGEPAAVP